MLYLGEINDGQRQAWCRLIEAFDEDAERHRQLALFPADRAVLGMRRRSWRAGAARRDGVASAATMGCVLVGVSVVRATRT